MRLPVGLLAVALLACGAERWRIQYFYDEDDSSLSFNDIQFPSVQRGIAAGFLERKGRLRPAALVTADGGRSWTLTEPPDIALSLFFLNESLGWMVGRNGVYRTEEAGRSWTSLRGPRGLLRVYFLDEKRGWAVGMRKSIYATDDGGRTWKHVSTADEPKTTAEYTVYAWITFADARNGLIAGWSRPPRRGERRRLPDWMEPEVAAWRRERPTLSILVDTRDGGITWKPSVTSMFGQITRVRLAPDGRGLGLIEFPDTFEWPSEVFRLDWRTGKSQRVFRRADRAITDIALPPEGPAYLAAVEPQGAKIRLPVPGKLKVLRSTDLTNWEEMEVDYRAFARRAVLAAPTRHDIWLATDTGQILRLAGE